MWIWSLREVESDWIGARTVGWVDMASNDCLRCSSGDFETWWYCSRVGECVWGRSMGGDGSTGVARELKLS